MSISAKFYPQFTQTHGFPEALGPKEVCAALIERHDILVLNLWQNPFLLSPNTRAVRPKIAFVSLLEELLPLASRTLPECSQVVRHVQQRAAPLAIVNDPVQRICRSAFRLNTLKPCSIAHRAKLIMPRASAFSMTVLRVAQVSTPAAPRCPRTLFKEFIFQSREHSTASLAAPGR